MRSDLDMVYSWSLGNSVCRVAGLFGVNKGVASRVIARGRVLFPEVAQRRGRRVRPVSTVVHRAA